MDPKISGYVAIGAAVLSLIAVSLALSAQSTAAATEASLKQQMRKLVRKQVKAMDKDLIEPLRAKLKDVDDQADRNRRKIVELDGKWQNNAQVKDEMIAYTNQAAAKANQHASSLAEGIKRDIQAALEAGNRYADNRRTETEKTLGLRIEGLENKVNRELKLR